MTPVRRPGPGRVVPACLAACCVPVAAEALSPLLAGHWGIAALTAGIGAVLSAIAAFVIVMPIVSVQLDRETVSLRRAVISGGLVYGLLVFLVSVLPQLWDMTFGDGRSGYTTLRIGGTDLIVEGQWTTAMWLRQARLVLVSTAIGGLAGLVGWLVLFGTLLRVRLVRT